jgi:predicted metal-dependent hydrolase
MNIKKNILQIQELDIEVNYKKIKNLHIGVYPPHGKVRISAALHMDENSIRLSVIPRLKWIRNQIQKFKLQERQSKREMISGESHYFEGRRYRLQVITENGRPGVKILKNSFIQIKVPKNSTREEKEKVLENWYRNEMRKRISPLLEKWENKIGIKVNSVYIKKMKTLWGSCNSEEKRIWLNLELMKKPPQCLEYILVHEMIHFLERHHNDRFYALMDQFLPNWRSLKAELNRSPLSHAEWNY